MSGTDTSLTAFSDLSPSMLAHLLWLGGANPSSTPHPGLSEASLGALERRGLATGSRVGVTRSGRPVIAWRLTDAGLALRASARLSVGS